MYYPYFRGKQYELITIRETAKLLNQSKFIPIIEPVKETLAGLKKTLDILDEESADCIVIVNPHFGDHSDKSDNVQSFLEQEAKNHKNISIGIILSSKVTAEDVKAICLQNKDRIITLIHFGFTEAKLLVNTVGDEINNMRHVFLEDCCGKLYQKNFKSSQQRILLRDGFQRRVNREHPPLEFFSDLHITYEDEGMNGFGDFLIVGNDYSESGGPAYAIAIHLTFIDKEQDGAMYIHHFVSDTQNTPKDPAGKFAEALNKLVNEVNKPDSKILKSEAVKELIELHNKKHFPGLGYVKKLSMKHHIETLANFFESN
jgi:hypothetical protein